MQEQSPNRPRRMPISLFHYNRPSMKCRSTGIVNIPFLQKSGGGVGCCWGVNKLFLEQENSSPNSLGKLFYIINVNLTAVSSPIIIFANFYNHLQPNKAVAILQPSILENMLPHIQVPVFPSSEVGINWLKTNTESKLAVLPQSLNWMVDTREDINHRKQLTDYSDSRSQSSFRLRCDLSALQVQFKTLVMFTHTIM